MSDDTPMPETGEETTKALIASLKQGKGITFRSSINPEFLTQLDKLLAEVDTSQIGAPDTLIFTAEEVFPEGEMRLTVEGHAPVSGRAEQVTLTQTREMHGMFWGEPEGFVFALGDKFLRLGGKFIQADTPEEEPEAEQEWRRLCEVLNDRNRSRGFKPPFAEPPIASAQNPPALLPSKARGRTGERIQASQPDFMRIPTAQTAHDTMTAFFAPSAWRPNEAGTAIYAQRGETQVMLDCDDAIGFGPERAILQIAQYGPATAQTFLALAGLWLRDKQGQSHETYMTISATDLLRFQRKSGHGGSYNETFHNDEIMAKGRDVWVLSRITVPKAEAVTYKNGKQVRSLSIGPLFMVQSFDVQQTLDAADVKSIVRFRYHLGKDMFEWLCGENPQFRAVSGKLLAYHPTRQKLQILLGFSLAYYDRVNDKQPRTKHKISLPALLNLSGLEIDKANPKRFLEQVEGALLELASDGVIPNVALRKPENWAALLAERRSREVLRLSSVDFPRLAVTAPMLRQVPA